MIHPSPDAPVLMHGQLWLAELVQVHAGSEKKTPLYVAILEPPASWAKGLCRTRYKHGVRGRQRKNWDDVLYHVRDVWGRPLTERYNTNDKIWTPRLFKSKLGEIRYIHPVEVIR